MRLRMNSMDRSRNDLFVVERIVSIDRLITKYPNKIIFCTVLICLGHVQFLHGTIGLMLQIRKIIRGTTLTTKSSSIKGAVPISTQTNSSIFTKFQAMELEITAFSRRGISKSNFQVFYNLCLLTLSSSFLSLDITGKDESQ